MHPQPTIETVDSHPSLDAAGHVRSTLASASIHHAHRCSQRLSRLVVLSILPSSRQCGSSVSTISLFAFGPCYTALGPRYRSIVYISVGTMYTGNSSRCAESTPRSCCRSIAPVIPLPLCTPSSLSDSLLCRQYARLEQERIMSNTNPPLRSANPAANAIGRLSPSHKERIQDAPQGKPPEKKQPIFM